MINQHIRYSDYERLQHYMCYLCVTGIDCFGLFYENLKLSVAFSRSHAMTDDKASVHVPTTTLNHPDSGIATTREGQTGFRQPRPRY